MSKPREELVAEHSELHVLCLPDGRRTESRTAERIAAWLEKKSNSYLVNSWANQIRSGEWKR